MFDTGNGLIKIKSTPPFLARIAFCYGPLREEIEFFQEK